MEILKQLLIALAISSLSSAILVHAQDQSGFISLDCGLPENSSYAQAITGIDYISDAPYIQTGISKRILPEFRPTVIQEAWYLRSFPEGIRNCYNLTLRKGDKYLIRAVFVYGNYDEKNEIPRFDLHLGPNFWGTVSLTNISTDSTMDIIHVLPSNNLHVCLVNTGTGTPFISSLELRLLNNNTYKTETGSLVHFGRFDIAAETLGTFRYKEDVYDRVWWPYSQTDWTQINTSLTIDTRNGYQPPLPAMRTTGTPVNAKLSMNFSINADPGSELYVYFHFAELEVLKTNESRVFNISYNGDFWYGPFSPVYLTVNTIYSTSAMIGEEHKFSIIRTEDSTHPPILNAIEIYVVKNFSQSETVQKDVDAILSIKSMYGLKRNWEGDPCAPQDYLWEGLNCSYNGYNPPRIISLDLSSSGLTGEIPSSIESLTQLQYLDLSNNNLTGEVPEFLSKLQFLTVLNLEGNMLNGTVPAKLLERANNGLTLSIDGNPNLCASHTCKKKKKKVVVPVVAAVCSFSVLIIALATLWKLKRRKPLALEGQMDVASEKSSLSLETKKRLFTYADIERMTNNFERIIGKGGFGTVFHGYLDDIQVAVKMLSPSSIQGDKQFQAEVKLLIRVHHKNLTNLIGYCNEGTNLGLIYEYMAKGNLAEHLSDVARSTNILSWGRRLHIALEAAQGLEYLHNGCKPPIIHRDVKSTNILLNEDFQAKLADFGLSKAFPIEGGTHVSASIAGTPGYLDPEYYISNRLTEKSDVYSFGIVLLEIITSRPVVIIRNNNERTHISQWVSSMLSMGDVKSIVDPRLRGDFDVNSVWKAVEIAMTCLSQTSARRPTMNQVVMELSECLSAETTRNRRDHENESQDIVGSITMNLASESTPLARFISLDCGLPENSSYINAITGIDYIPDAPYIQSGISKEILPEFRPTVQQEVWYLRSFPEGVRNYYNVTLRKGVKYLIRAVFMYGNYDKKNEIPSFDLHLGPNFWATVKSDVYSLGIVPSEIITSRPVLIIRNNNERSHISEWVSSMLSLGGIQSIVDQKNILFNTLILGINQDLT